jgi:hypothetical protein
VADAPDLTLVRVNTVYEALGVAGVTETAPSTGPKPSLSLLT